MVKSKKKSKLVGKEGDFARKVQKVGKKTQALNATNTTFKSKALVIPAQGALTTDRSSSVATSSRSQTLPELLAHTGHPSPAVRRDAAIGMTSLFSRHPESLLPSLGIVLDKIAPLLVDPEPRVRVAVKSLMESHVLLPSHSISLAPHAPMLLAYIRAALTHVSTDTRLDGLATLSSLARQVPSVLSAASSGSAAALLPLYVDLLSFSTSSSISGSSLSASSSGSSSTIAANSLGASASASFLTLKTRLDVLESLYSVLEATLSSLPPTPTEAFVTEFITPLSQVLIDTWVSSEPSAVISGGGSPQGLSVVLSLWLLLLRAALNQASAASFASSSLLRPAPSTASSGLLNPIALPLPSHVVADINRFMLPHFPLTKSAYAKVGRNPASQASKLDAINTSLAELLLLALPPTPKLRSTLASALPLWLEPDTYFNSPATTRSASLRVVQALLVDQEVSLSVQDASTICNALANCVSALKKADPAALTSCDLLEFLASLLDLPAHQRVSVTDADVLNWAAALPPILWSLGSKKPNGWQAATKACFAVLRGCLHSGAQADSISTYLVHALSTIFMVKTAKHGAVAGPWTRSYSPTLKRIALSSIIGNAPASLVRDLIPSIGSCLLRENVQQDEINFVIGALHGVMEVAAASQDPNAGSLAARFVGLLQSLSSAGLSQELINPHVARLKTNPMTAEVAATLRL